jgi:hypothetical protein
MSMPTSRPNFSGGQMGSAGQLGGAGAGNFSRPNLGNSSNLSRPNVINNPNMSRPNLGNNTNINRPNLGNNTNINRPNLGNNTNINRPNFGNNTNINRPNFGNNTNINRPNFGNNTNINRQNFGGNTNINRNNITNINNTVMNFNRPGGGYVGGAGWGGAYRPGGVYPGVGGGGWGYRPGWGYHSGWVNGYWHGNWAASNWNWGSFAAGAALGGLAGWGFGSMLWNWGYSPYINPYYAVAAAPVVVQQPVIVEGQAISMASPYDYSQPINTTGPPPDPSVSDPAVAAFDEARAAFKNGEYYKALDLTNKTLKTLPNDATAHEFRALCLFAIGQYEQASAPIYAVLSVGPGWDWTTMVGLYPDVDTYTTQLRSLEAYVRDHSSSPQARFLLAYHYLTQGNTDAAVTQYQDVVALQPGDKLSASLINAFGPKDANAVASTDAAAPAPGAPAAGDQPPAQAAPELKSAIPAPPESAIAGTWKATPAPDVTIALTLQPERKFSWGVTQKGQTQTFSGESTYGGETLTLVQSTGPAMVGKLAWADSNHFRFQIVGAPADDPGLSFSR